MATDGLLNGSEVARLRALAEQYRRLAASVTDPAALSAMRQMANDYDADADEMEAQNPQAAERGVIKSPASPAPIGGMGFGCILAALLRRPNLDNGTALALMIAAIMVPTLLRISVSGFVSGTEFLAYVPFVFLAALLLKPWLASSVAVSSALAADYFFMEPQFRLAVAPGDLFGMGVFLVYCGMTICLVRAFRLTLALPGTMQLAQANTANA